jgi:hypothetical protein
LDNRNKLYWNYFWRTNANKITCWLAALASASCFFGWYGAGTVLTVFAIVQSVPD